jgi:hypothetical protein
MKLFVGWGLLLTGLALIFFNRPLAQAQKFVDELFGMGSVSSRFNRTVFYIVETLLSATGLLVLLGRFTIQ